ncbi:MAG: ferritin family protein [Bacteroidota bacterium]
MVAKDLTLLEVLSIAIRSETDAQNIYREMAERVSNPRGEERFHLLVAEERQHQNLLEMRYKEFFPDVRLKLPPSLLSPTAVLTALRKDLSLPQVLSIAIQAERDSREIYLEAAAKVNDMGWKSILKSLADWEHTHQMKLTTEYDMLMKCPSYYENVAEPWQEELHL